MVVETAGARAADTPTGTRTGGTGLIGLRERLADLGGDVTARSLPGGRFVVRARLPLTDGVVAAPTTAGVAS
jgi:glucose-6-phosphate-specific signal transduction histidine kinase